MNLIWFMLLQITSFVVACVLVSRPWIKQLTKERELYQQTIDARQTDNYKVLEELTSMTHDLIEERRKALHHRAKREDLSRRHGNVMAQLRINIERLKGKGFKNKRSKLEQSRAYRGLMQILEEKDNEI